MLLIYIELKILDSVCSASLSHLYALCLNSCMCHLGDFRTFMCMKVYFLVWVFVVRKGNSYDTLSKANIEWLYRYHKLQVSEIYRDLFLFLLEKYEDLAYRHWNLKKEKIKLRRKPQVLEGLTLWRFILCESYLVKYAPIPCDNAIKNHGVFFRAEKSLWCS